jgi:hypothetical protein
MGPISPWATQWCQAERPRHEYMGATPWCLPPSPQECGTGSESVHLRSPSLTYLTQGRREKCINLSLS